MGLCLPGTAGYSFLLTGLTPTDQYGEPLNIHINMNGEEQSSFYLRAYLDFLTQPVANAVTNGRAGCGKNANEVAHVIDLSKRNEEEGGSSVRGRGTEGGDTATERDPQ